MTDGLVVVDKPAGWTSHDVVARCRKVFGQKRVGHGGTLDPDATGVLLVGLGRVTRLLKFIGDLSKSYTGEVVMGTATSTLDSSGGVTGEWDMSGVALADVQRAALAFTGDLMQVPPMVSAVSIGGKRLHQLARAGVEVEREPRAVRVDRFDVLVGPDAGVFAIDIKCSSGTYVRSLAADLGTALGGGAHLRNLRRTAIGSFGVEAAVALDRLAENDVRPPVAAVAHLPSVAIGADDAVAVAHGKPLPDLPSGVVAVLSEDGALLAVYKDRRPDVVLVG